MSTREENNPNSNQNPNQNQDQNWNQNQDSNSNSGTGDNTAPFQIKGNWGQQSNQLKERYSELTDSDLNFQPGQENQLLNQIGTRLNKSREEVIDILNQNNQGYNQNQGNQGNQENQGNQGNQGYQGNEGNL